ncbi:MAG: proline--tRNA ligase [Thermoproteus sp. AZ2]|uniref:Proline--tRNA ligase n=1 Tax=Thermoproteus sp. AZ2 TaxID=1609232 RepID=A0ACC6V243_9CREN
MELIRGPRPHPKEKLSRNLMEWFHWLLREAEIYDIRYPVKGAFVWMPYGMKIRRRIEALLRELHDSTGHQEVLFPVFIPYEFFSKESQHIRGFESEVFWVSKGGEGGERLILRPTSETAIMPMFKLWIHDYKDLPLAVYQIVSVFRAETKMTNPMIRVREISMFKEAHTAHADREDAERQVRLAVDIYKKFFDALCIPYLISRRPEWDKFAGAVYTIAFDTVLPDGRTLQIGTVHYLGTNFSKVFEVAYLKPDGSHEYVHTTSYGISERSIAAMLITHGDDAGTTLPPKTAPIQVVVVPIYYGEEKAEVLSAAESVARELSAAGIRTYVDSREDKTPGWKFYYWELKGAPLRLEIGRRDLEKGAVAAVRRDTLAKYSVPIKELVDSVKSLLEEVEADLRKSAWERLRSSVVQAATLEEAKKALEAGRVVEVPWSGEDQCGIKAAEALGADALGIPLDKEADVGGADLRDLGCAEKRANYWLRLSERY